MRLSSALVLSAIGAVADASDPRGTSWSPPKQTDQSNLQYGRAPKPTVAPRPGALFGRMPLQARLAGFVMDPAICGYDAVLSDHSIGCGIAGQTCTYASNGYGGCCPATGSCSSIQTTCIGGDDAQSCIRGSPNTLCCADAGVNQCYTWIFSTTAVGGQPGRRNTLFSCAATAAQGTLLDYDPQWSKTHFPQSTSTSAPVLYVPSSPSLSVGAIVGIVIGALAVLAIALAAFCLRRRAKKQQKGASSKKERPQHHRAISELSGSEPPNRGRPAFNESPFSPNQQTGLAAAKARREISPLASEYSLSSRESQDPARRQPYHQHQRWGSLDQHATPSPVPKDDAKSPKLKSPESQIAELPDYEIGTRGNRAELG